MEITNVTPEKLLSLVTRLGLAAVALALVWRLPEIILALK